MDPDTLSGQLAALLRQVADNPLAAADRLEATAARLLALARALRAQGGTRDRGGIGDRVQMTVCGPDGTIRKSVDTGGSP